ncbi:LruC domain-containing protein [Parabacteroides sp. OttesenSCG-928-N08]|nr:LruC domain-containing protein [Parabacteroides sp. OttesenSCG-928-N08]
MKRFSLFLLLTVLFTACQEDVYVPKEPIDPPLTPDVSIDWSTNYTTTLNVFLDDEYNGEYFYTIEAFVGNPAINSNAKLIPGSGQKVNKNTSYSRKITIPDMLEAIYIRVTDPFKRKAVYEVEVQMGTINFYVGESNGTKAGSFDNMKTEIPTFDFPTQEEMDAMIQVTGSKFSIKANGKYLIPAGTTFSGELDINGGAEYELYIAGNLNFSPKKTNGQAYTIQSKSKFIVLNGGTLDFNEKAVEKLWVSGQFVVQEGGIVNTETTSGSGELRINTESSPGILNHGTIITDNLNLPPDKTALYNTGSITATKMESNSKNTVIVNQGNLSVVDLTLTNSTLENGCKMTVSNSFASTDGTIILTESAYLQAKDINVIGVSIYMDALSMFEAETALFRPNLNTITGSDDDYALFKADYLDVKGWDANKQGLTLKGKVECKFNTIKVATNNSLGMVAPARTADGEATVAIPVSDCNNSGNSNENDNDGDDDNKFEETETLSYLYLFEDNWPVIGDYDMNDLVMSVNFKNETANSKTSAVTIEATLYAVGGTKQLGVAFQLDGIDASNVQGAMPGMKNAVIQLFDNAHTQLGAPSGIAANVRQVDYPKKTFTKTITFNTPIDGTIDANNFNLFVVNDGDFSKEEWNEIHIYGFKGTEKAAVNENSTVLYAEKSTGWMWGLCLPVMENVNYPFEGVRIDDSYTGFTSWVNSNLRTSWYTNPIEGKVLFFDK